MSGGSIIEDPLMRTLVDPDAALEKLWTGAVWWEDGHVRRASCARMPSTL